MLNAVRAVFSGAVISRTGQRMASTGPSYEALAVSSVSPYVYHVELNRPEKLNAFNEAMWHNLGECFNDLGQNADCRAIVLSGAGKLFTAGIDLNSMVKIGASISEQDDVARRCKILSNFIKKYQDAITSLEKCPKPVIAAIHGACIGAGINLVTAADIRYCTKDAWFQVKEVAIGLAADVGVLQRLPKVTGNDSLCRELSYTARKLLSSEAKEFGLLSKVFDDKESMMKEAFSVAASIASHSPVAVQGTKKNLVFSRDHTVQEGLDNIRDWNMVMLQSEDFMNAAAAAATKSGAPEFSKL
ncbi:delta(3,5)-Delta(2,4)-dienoyl-CoA isomerase, mitochondrial isoform X1 [Schistocerca serialis cubense]|uniref:delta(3,5)-Delta(2,4)-dienoyl-CoA isomerase, mitochondrial isoform X1 n=2 Tax=Schistocerca serialis cubense TaxID=2023355 RepID=UPI00214EA2AD|nr:delta(3,5)-Delta(2,4)-dienoyl-CoA isomerase, mitochondrial isoform X1 [Schistocerca serialis cubense]